MRPLLLSNPTKFQINAQKSSNGEEMYSEKTRQMAWDDLPVARGLKVPQFMST